MNADAVISKLNNEHKLKICAFKIKTCDEIIKRSKICEKLYIIRRKEVKVEWTDDGYNLSF